MSLSASSEPIPDTTEDRRRGRRVAFAILALCAAPTVAAWLAYFVWQPQSRLNYGELIEARTITDPELRRLDGSPFRLSQLRGRWVLLQIDSAACAEASDGEQAAGRARGADYIRRTGVSSNRKVVGLEGSRHSGGCGASRWLRNGPPARSGCASCWPGLRGSRR